MADTKISALTSVATPAGTDIFAVDQGGVSKGETLSQISAYALPLGIICMWSGTIATIPTNWALCDGTANSPGPDLRNQFVVGANADSGGAAKTTLTGSATQSGAGAVSSHTLSTNVAVSAHTLSTNVAIANHTLTTGTGRTSTASTQNYDTTTSLTHTITQPVVAAHSITQPVVAGHTSVWPAYYALAFIQKMS